jgi:effector-binding domain-containing protein
MSSRMDARAKTLPTVVCALWAMSLPLRADEPPPAATAPEIVLKQPDPAVVVFLEQTGPYWTVGPLFRQARELMLAHNEAGPLFARYATDPTTVAPEALRTRVGFVAKGEWAPEPPFRSAEYESEQVAAMVVEGSYGTTTRYYPVMREWLSAHGFEPVGPVIELYPPVARGTWGGTQRTEIQMPVRRPRVPEPPAAPVVASAENEPQRFFDSWEAPGDAPETQDTPTADERPTGPIREPGAVSALAAPEPIQPVRELIAVSRFDRIAEQLIPVDRPTPAALQVWLGQVVFRVSAVAKGIEQTFPGGAPQVTALSEAIVRRYRQASESSNVNPLESAVVHVDMRSDPHSAQRRSIVRDLDNLLGQVAIKTVDADSALGRLEDILQRIQDLMHSAQP